MPERIPTKKENPKYKNILKGLLQTVGTRLLPAIYSNTTRNTSDKNKAKTMATVLVNTDSTRNWTINRPREVPNVLRIPTSLARLEALAVVRLTKLTAANTRINSEIAEKTYIFISFPPGDSSRLNLDFR